MKKKSLAPDKGFAFEPGDDCRNQYLQPLERIPEERRVSVDETGFNEPVIREYAYAKQGRRIRGERTGKRFARTSLIAGLRGNKPVAPMEFKGYCDTEVVRAWLTQMLIPQWKPKDVVIWDNATFHRRSRLANALSEAGIGLLFLSAYSRDLNPIEQFWAWLKAWIRTLNQPLLHISQALTQGFKTITG